MLKLLCRAFCLALCFSFALVGNAELTQAQMQQAFYDALMAWGYDTSGEEGVPYVFAIDQRTLDGFFEFLDSAPGSRPSAIGNTSYQILRMLYGDRPEFWNNLRSIVQTNAVTDLQLASEMNELERQLNLHLPYLDSMTYTPSSELRVHDDGLNSLVSNMVFDSAGVGADLSSLLSYSIGIENDLSYIRSRFEAEEALDETATSVVSRAETAQEDEYETKLQEALDEYDSIPLPEEEDQYETQAVDPNGPSPDDVFGNLNTSVTHSAILQLVPRGEEILPEIEVDFGRDSSFVSFCLRLNDLTDWLYPILGTFVLSLKGLAMWRTVRQASIAASASGDSPIVSLAWSPF